MYRSPPRGRFDSPQKRESSKSIGGSVGVSISGERVTTKEESKNALRVYTSTPNNSINSNNSNNTQNNHQNNQNSPRGNPPPENINPPPKLLTQSVDSGQTSSNSQNPPSISIHIPKVQQLRVTLVRQPVPNTGASTTSKSVKTGEAVKGPCPNNGGLQVSGGKMAIKDGLHLSHCMHVLMRVAINRLEDIRLFETMVDKAQERIRTLVVCVEKQLMDIEARETARHLTETPTIILMHGCRIEDQILRKYIIYIYIYI